MNFENINLLGGFGFRGGLRVQALQRSCSAVPDSPGVYLIVRKSNSIVQFVKQGVGGHFRDRDPNVDTSELQRRWLREPSVIYIGKASRSLSRRIHSYMQFGCGQPCGHWGGRYIWQLADAGQLLVFWKPVRNKMATAVETRLLGEFRQYYGRLPFANLRH